MKAPGKLDLDRPERRDYADSARPKTAHHVSVHGVLVRYRRRRLTSVSRAWERFLRSQHLRPRCRCQSRPGWRGSRSRPRESAPVKGAGFWRRSPRESDPGCTSRQCAEPRRRYRRCKAGPCGSLAISQSGCRYRHGGHFLRSILLGVGPFSDSVDGSNDRSGAFYREYVDRPGTAEKRLRANQPHGCRLPPIDAQYPCQYSVQVRDAP